MSVKRHDLPFLGIFVCWHALYWGTWYKIVRHEKSLWQICYLYCIAHPRELIQASEPQHGYQRSLDHVYTGKWKFKIIEPKVSEKLKLMSKFWNFVKWCSIILVISKKIKNRGHPATFYIAPWICLNTMSAIHSHYKVHYFKILEGNLLFCFIFWIAYGSGTNSKELKDLPLQ